ncbi:MAG TPA: beta-ketoacyl-ACP synthase II [Gemmatimonadales bacterium]|nr:beta-ketoacyl-ACP synthase II [Gemmatimonadales bacterium]
MTGVVITGIGCVTPIGTGVEGLWGGLRAKRSAVRGITRFDPSPFPSQIAAEIDDFRPEDHLPRKTARRLDRFSQLGVVAARLAVDDAALVLEREDRDRIGVTMGSALGGVAQAEAQAAAYLRRGLNHVDPRLAISVFGGAVSCNIAIQYGATGPNATNSMSCAAGAIAIGEAFHAIRSGRADVMLAGGAEAPLSPLSFGAFTLIRAMSTRNGAPERASRPFDRDRDGFVMGEGAAVLVLERQDRALARGARIYAEICGYALTNDAFHMAAPKPDGREAARAVRLALADAHVEPHEVEYVNAHGSSTPLNDATETLVVKQVFGEHAYHLAITGTKGYYGHPLGASGAIEAAICALGMARGWLPPTVNLDAPDPCCDLNYLPNGGLQASPRCVVSNAFGFGGVNAVLVLRQAS